eukprot:gene2166-4215_t
MAEQDIDHAIHMRWDQQKKFNDEIKRRLRSGWRNDEAILNEFFDACVLNYKLFTGERTQKQTDRLYGIYKQALFGDCNTLQISTDSSKISKWKEWNRLLGMPKSMAKRKYITLLAEIDPKLIDVLPNEKPPDGFPLDANGVQICAKCNTVVGCCRPVTDDHQVDLRTQLFEVEDLHQPRTLQEWVQNALKKQRCIWGVHKPIAKVDAKLFQEWFERRDNLGFSPYNNDPILNMIHDLLEYIYQITYDMQCHRDEYTKDEYNEQSLKAINLTKYYKELTGEDFIFEVACTRDIEVCNNRRKTENGKNHMHPVQIDPPAVDYSTYEDALKLRKECIKIGANPCTGVVKDINERCEIYRQRIAERLAVLKESAEAKIRNETRTSTHMEEKKSLDLLSFSMIERQISDACHANNYMRVLSFIRKGRDPNLETNRGITPLTCCIINHAPLEIIQELLTRKADSNHMNRYGITPLMLSCHLKEKKLIHVLVKYGAVIETVIPEHFRGAGNSALHLCAIHGGEDEIK